MIMFAASAKKNVIKSNGLANMVFLTFLSHFIVNLAELVCYPSLSGDGCPKVTKF